MMVSTAIVCAVLAIVCIVVTVISFLNLMPKVITGSGNAGDDVLARTTAPGTLELNLPPDEYYSAWLISTYANNSLKDGSTQTTADGTVKDFSTRRGTSNHMRFNGVEARQIADFRITSSGPMTIEFAKPVFDDPGAEIFITQATAPGRVMGSVALGIALILGAVFFGIAAIGLGIGGGVWWSTRASAKKRQAQVFAAHRPSL